ncbi:MAG: hypothetical protein ABI647_15485, partial [Gemmatimonadota bacterium]
AAVSRVAWTSAGVVAYMIASWTRLLGSGLQAPERPELRRADRNHHGERDDDVESAQRVPGPGMIAAPAGADAYR